MEIGKGFTTILSIFIIFIFFQLSCKTTQQSAVSCPEFSKKKGNYISHHKRSRTKVISAQRMDKRIKNINRSGNNQSNEISNAHLISGATSPLNNLSVIKRVDYQNGLIASTENIIYPGINNVASNYSLMKPYFYDGSKDAKPSQQTKCDTILLKSGGILIGKVEEIGQSEIKYRKCNNLTGPLISIMKYDVSGILYSNGTRDLFGPSDTPIPNQVNFPTYTNNTTLKTEGLGLAGFISGFVGLFIASIPLGIIAVIFGLISLSKIRRNPQRLRGKGFAITAIVLGIVDVVVMIILLASV